MDEYTEKYGTQTGEYVDVGNGKKVWMVGPFRHHPSRRWTAHFFRNNMKGKPLLTLHSRDTNSYGFADRDFKREIKYWAKENRYE